MEIVLVRVNTKLAGLTLGGEYPVKMTQYVEAAINAGHLTVIAPPGAAESPSPATESDDRTVELSESDGTVEGVVDDEA